MVYSRVSPIRDPVFRREWATWHPYCFACGCDGTGWGRWLECHHIIRYKRSDEACNLANLCARDHSLFHGARIAQEGRYLPNLTLAMVLTLKRLRTPHEYDAARLAELYGQALPEPEEVPDFFQLEWRRNRVRA